MAEDRTYSVTAGKGRTSVNYAVDHDLGGGSGFQTGSSFKPFTLADWLQTGHSLGDTVDATKRAFPFSDFTSCGDTLRGTSYSPGNSEGDAGGNMSVATATADSVNVAYVAMETQLDLCDIANTAQSLGVHLAFSIKQCTSTGDRSSTDLPVCFPSLTLGVEDIAPLTMAAAYAGFASGGTYCTPVPISSITKIGSDGVTQAQVSVPGSTCTTALTSSVASGVNTALEPVLTSGTAAAVGPLNPWPSAGKTGTTNGPQDTWFVGYTAQRSTAVWVGDPGSGNGRKTLRNITVAGHYWPTVFGASIAAPIWKDTMDAAMKNLPAEDLP
jgi:membrane peptidoglycan carboxypeptidase